MPVDPEYLRQHYASLSDEAFLAIDRAELVETAQQCYDDEFAQRQLNSRRDVRRGEARPVAHSPQEPARRSGDGDQPDWLEEAAEVYRADSRGGTPAPDVTNAREALEAAGIPCRLDEVVTPADTTVVPEQHQWRLMVPGNLNIHAASVLERDIFNADFEAGWKAHLEALPDEDLLEMDPQVVLCGLFDRVERATRAYDEELARRGL